MEEKEFEIPNSENDLDAMPETEATPDAQESETTQPVKKGDAARLAAHRNRKAKDKFRWDARARDTELFAETAKLQDSAKQIYNHRHANHKQSEVDSALEFIWYGEQVLRSISWRLKYPNFSIQDRLYTEEAQKEIHEKEYMLCIPDAACYRMVEIARYDIHLTPELSVFGVKVYEKFLSWAHKSDEYGLDWMHEIRAELEARKLGEDTFTIPKPPPGKRGPKPKQPELSTPADWSSQPAIALEPAELRAPVQPEQPELSLGQQFLAEKIAEVRRTYSGLSSDAAKFLEGS